MDATSDLIYITVHRQQYKAKAFDPISVDYIDIVDDWVVDRSALFSGPAEQPNWMEITQPFNWTPSAGPGDEFESFIEGTYLLLACQWVMLRAKH